MNRTSITLCLVAVLLAGCITNARVPRKPAADGLTGWYRFSGTGKSRPEEFPNALIDWADVAMSSRVQLVQKNGEGIVARYVDRNGTVVERFMSFESAPEGTTFNGGQLSFKRRDQLEDAPMLPGVASQFVGTRYYRDVEGNLRVIGSFTERGLMLFLFPFVDHHESEFVLEADDP